MSRMENFETRLHSVIRFRHSYPSVVPPKKQPLKSYMGHTEEILYPTLFFKEIIYLCKRVDNRIVRVARPRIRFKNKQSIAII